MSGKVPPSQVSRAGNLYREFSGHEPDETETIEIPEMPRAVLVIGELEGVIYSTVRDDVGERYIHRFKKSSRPLLCASPDGEQLFIVGGSFEFTDRGIVDT
ncbi:MAG: hypothetical protein KGJ13_11825 [Patescibacteria group bacterium]|nr:hypothetical protein [Patescibacteria group bacterium]